MGQLVVSSYRVSGSVGIKPNFTDYLGVTAVGFLIGLASTSMRSKNISEPVVSRYLELLEVRLLQFESKKEQPMR